MKIRIKTQNTYDPILRQMAADAGVSLADLGEIALYNLIAVWTKEHGETEVAEGGLEIARIPRAFDLSAR